MKKGKIIMICGLPGSGKTTLSKKLAQKKKTIRLCPDEWIISLGMSNRYTDAKNRPIIEDLQWNLATQTAGNGLDVILENGYWSAKDRLAYSKKARDLDISTKMIFLDINLDELKSRIKSRNKNLPEHSLKVSLTELEKWYNQFESPSTQELKTLYTEYKIYKT